MKSFAILRITLLTILIITCTGSREIAISWERSSGDTSIDSSETNNDSVKTNPESQDDDLTRFLNVKAWKGKITISIYGNVTSNTEDTDTKISVNHFYNQIFVTDDGSFQPMDPFLMEDPAGKKEPGEQDQGTLNGAEEALQKLMEQMDPSLAKDIQESLKQAQGMNLAVDKYKAWNVMGGGSMDENQVTYTVNDRKIHRFYVHTEGCQYCCRITQEEIYEFDEGFGPYFFTLSVNLEKEVYSFASSFGEQKIKLKKELSYIPNSCRKADVYYENQASTVIGPTNSLVHAKNAESKIKSVALPTTGLVLMGTDILENFYVIEDPENPDGKPVNAEISWQIIPADQEFPEVYINLTNEDWIPEENNTAEVELQWENVVPSQVRFRLYDVSEEPGTCLNSKDKNTELDLEIDTANPGYEISGDKTEATKKNPLPNKEVLIINSRDYGAHGRIKAEIMVNGTWIPAEVKGLPGGSLHLPFDQNQNHIADKWEKDVGIFEKGYGPDWDEDPYPALQKKDGDGYTLYEEYRGFIARGHVLFAPGNIKRHNDHFRMDPNHKDVFIYDQNELFNTYYSSANPARLNWHYVDPTLMVFKSNALDPEHRWVNYNTSKTYFDRQQYAVHLMSAAGKLSGTDMGINRNLAKILQFQDKLNNSNTLEGSVCNVMPPPHPLRCIYLVNIYPGVVLSAVSKYNPAEKDRLFQSIMTSTTIHEIGHALGVQHHYNMETKKETDESPYTGVLTCAMRYENLNDFLHPGFVTMDRYCDQGEKWRKVANQENTSDVKPIEFEEYESHNCFGQINIKGD